MYSHHKNNTQAHWTRLVIVALTALISHFTVSPGALASPGDLYVTDLATGSVLRYEPDGTAHTFATGLISPQGIAFDGDKNLYVADAGDGGSASGVIWKYDLSGNRVLFRNGLDNPAGLDTDGMASGGGLLVAERGQGRVLRLPLSGAPPTIVSLIANPTGIFSQAPMDQSGVGFFRFIAAGPVVREIAPPSPGTVTDFDFSTDPARNVAVDTNFNLFVTTEGGRVMQITVSGGTVATRASGLSQPTGMDFRPAKFSGDTDRVGFLYVADTGTGEILQISTAGVQSTFVSGAGQPNYVTFEVNDPNVPPTPTPTPTLTPTPTPTPTPSGTPIPPKALNISTRVNVLTGDEVAIAGFIINGGTQPKKVIIRALGPALSDLGVSGALADPVLELHDSTGVITTNDGWRDNNATDRASISAAGLDKSSGTVISDLEPVIVATLPASNPAVPGSGQYTAVVRGSDGGTGVALVEVYDLDDAAAPAELANISTRGAVGTGDDVLIGGIIVGPEQNGAVTNATVIVRAIGPSLAGVSNVLADPFVELHNGNGDMIGANDNWQDDDNAAEITAAHLNPGNAAEASMMATLVPGGYTAIVRGNDNGTGVALVEVYHVLNPGASN